MPKKILGSTEIQKEEKWSLFGRGGAWIYVHGQKESAVSNMSKLSSRVNKKQRGVLVQISFYLGQADRCTNYCKKNSPR